VLRLFGPACLSGYSGKNPKTILLSKEKKFRGLQWETEEGKMRKCMEVGSNSQMQRLRGQQEGESKLWGTGSEKKNLRDGSSAEKKGA